jgi:hypothetical protein
VQPDRHCLLGALAGDTDSGQLGGMQDMLESSNQM